MVHHINFLAASGEEKKKRSTTDPQRGLSTNATAADHDTSGVNKYEMKLKFTIISYYLFILPFIKFSIV